MYRKFSEETPGQLINQFPFEMVLTVKSVLAVVCRRGVSPVIDPLTLESSPPWLPATFNMQTELAQFVSYFQHRQKRYQPRRTPSHTHTRLTALFRDYPGEPVPER